jgi:2-desacetyl-2-hydroxyethyl bacteriochlorophyllide A dehydrogenase
MKTLVCTEPGSMQYMSSNMVVPAKGQAIVRIQRVGICGTDLHAFDGTQPYFSYPRVLGHELAGELVDYDGGKGFTTGDAVSIIPYFNCGACIACRNGKTNCCSQMKVFGVHVDGGMSEYVSVPASTLLHGNGLSMDELAMIEPLAVAAHAIRRAAITPGEYVLVIGAGPIGLGVMEFARLAGAHVIAMDINEGRLRFAKETLGIIDVEYSEEHINGQLMAITKGDMPTVVFDATGSQKAINSAFQYMAHGARYILVGLQKNDISFSHPEFHKREGTLLSSRNATREDFDRVIHAIETKMINPTRFITHRIAFGKAAEQFSTLIEPASGVTKAMIEMQ